MAFDTQIQELAGANAPFTDQTAMDQWMNDGAREIINIVSKEEGAISIVSKNEVKKFQLI